MTEITPNQGQAAGLEQFFEFMIGPETVCHLSGGAGVGKTTLLNLIMTEGMDRYEEACQMFGIEQTIFSMELTATTNKAAEVLSVATGKTASTIHSFMGFVIKENYSTGETNITVGKNPKMVKNSLIIIDESSMIDIQLKAMLDKYTHKCKFLFVGDHCQMAPVKEKLSSIYLDKAYFINLTEQMRNAGQPALMELCTQLRETVETGVFKPIKAVPGVIEYLNASEMQAKVDEYFIDNNTNARILCYTNSKVKEYNSYIRQLRGLPAYFEEGEFLVSNSSFVSGENSLSVESEVEVISNPHVEKTIKVGDAEFNVYDLKVKKVKGGFPFNIQIPSDQDHHRALIKHFAGKKQWTNYFHLKNNYPDLRQKDACTVYKAQGSTYDAVFIDLSDISTCTHAEQVARMLYVAGSRPQQKIYLSGKLKPAYSGE